MNEMNERFINETHLPNMSTGWCCASPASLPVLHCLQKAAGCCQGTGREDRHVQAEHTTEATATQKSGDKCPLGFHYPHRSSLKVQVSCLPPYRNRNPWQWASLPNPRRSWLWILLLKHELVGWGWYPPSSHSTHTAQHQQALSAFCQDHWFLVSTLFFKTYQAHI